MADDLNGKIYPAGTAAMTGLHWSFTVAPDDDKTPTLVDAAIALRIFRLTGNVSAGDLDKTRQLPPEPGAPTKVLTLGNGLTRDADEGNEAKLQSGDLTITAADTLVLLGDANVAAFKYFWVITPVNANPIATYLGGGYDGLFLLGREGWGIEALARVKS